MKVGTINNRVYQLIGLSKRAGKLISGSYSVEEFIKSRKAQLVIMSGDASLNTKKKFYNMCKYRDIDIIEVGSEEDLGKSIGKSNRIIVAITDRAFKDMILDAFSSSIINAGVID